MSKGQVDLVDMEVKYATIAINDVTLMCIHLFYLKSSFLCIQMKKKLPIAKLNSNFNSTTTSTWVENSINFVLVHPPTRASSDKLQLQLQIQLQFQLQLLAKLELGTAQPQLALCLY